MTTIGHDPDLRTGLVLDSSAGSDLGLIRPNNEDSAYTGRWLLAVADGVGGNVGGEVASSTAIRSLASTDAHVPAATLMGTLRRAVSAANNAIADRVRLQPALATMSTTLTAMLWSGGRAGFAHIGDSRAYLLRDDELQQLTTDHTLEQLRAGPGNGPVRHGSILLRALDGAINGPLSCEPDLLIHQARSGDRFLLCSDGLTGPVAPRLLHTLLQEAGSPADTVRELIEAANHAGGPDNVTVIVADVTPGPAAPSSTRFLGAAASPL
jgi:protein phosphatase